MPLTRTQGEAALKHVVVTVLDEPEDGELMKALKSEGYLKVSALTSLRETTIENLTYPEDDGTLSKVKQNQKGLLVAFCAFIKHRNDLSLPIGDDWTNITQEEYDDFRVSRSFDGTIHGLTPASRPGIPPAPSARAPAARDPIADFQRGIKRDASLFPALKDEKEFDNWQRITTAQCKAQDISEVLDPNYRPNTTEDRELFKKKQEYMYAVLVNTLKTDQGQSCVRKFATTSDAQSIYRDVVEHNLKSTKASISAGKSLAYVTCTTIGEGSDWRGTTEAFIHHWQDQVRLYETLVNPDECFSSAHKKNMLQNAVRNVSELAIVKDTAAQLKAHDGREQTYDSYSGLLLSAAATYDSNFAPKTFSGSHPPRRAVYSHDNTESNGDNDDPVYDIDCTLDALQANTHSSGGDQPNAHASATGRPPGTSMAFSKWNQLSQDAKDIWDDLPDEAKAVILNHARPPGRGPARPSFRNTNLHDVSAHDYLLANTHDLRPGSNGDVDESSQALSVTFASDKKDHDDNSTALLKVLSTSIARPKSTTRSVNAAVRCSISTQEWSSNPGALVDRGTNGGVAGQDVRIIFETGRHVDVLGIDNHKVIEVPIVSAGSVMDTGRGPVIAIMNEYAYTGKGKTIHSCSQLEWYKNDVNDKSIKVPGGLQRIQTNDGYDIPIDIKDGLPYVKMRPFTDAEWDTLPHVILTNNVNWDPTVLDDDALDTNVKKLRADPPGGETITITKSRHNSTESGIDSNDGETKEYHHMPVLHPGDLIRFQARMVRAIEDRDGETADHPTSGTLIDRGATTAFIGADPRVISKTGWHVDVIGIDESFRHVREAIATGIIAMHETIFAEIIALYYVALGMHQQVWELLRPLLF
jgi:hypothetical protein